MSFVIVGECQSQDVNLDGSIQGWMFKSDIVYVLNSCSKYLQIFEKLFVPVNVRCCQDSGVVRDWRFCSGLVFISELLFSCSVVSDSL